MSDSIGSIGTVGANAPSAGFAVVGAAVKGAQGLQPKTSGEKNILGGESVKVTDGERNQETGFLAKIKRLAERRNPFPEALPPSDLPSATADPLAATP